MMTVRSYVSALVAGAAVAWGAWGWVIAKTDPSSDTIVPQLLFFVSLGIALLGTMGVALFLLRRLLYPEGIIGRELGIAMRESLWATLFVIIALILLHSHLLRWWNLVLLFLTLSVIEFLCLSFRSRPYRGHPISFDRQQYPTN